ncbi:MAG: 50S ribosomal protein L1 [Candidatus Levybacteria bacterium]|nr:50S ribosomal protein L1 [Candidatus Levybacteria bacterium]
MGKIRIKTIGIEEAEQGEKKAAKKKKEAKAAKKTHLPGMGGGERVVVVGPTEGELEALEAQKPAIAETSTFAWASTDAKALADKSADGQKQTETQKKKKSKFSKAKSRSARYSAKVIEIDKNKSYSLTEALELLKKVHLAKFDETVELHVNTTESGINGVVKLPHGSGKEIRVAVASDELIEQIEKGLPAARLPAGQGRQGKIDFDVLIASPSMMPRLAKVAKVLGPKGLMPNPKNGTISDSPEEAAKKFAGGQVNFKTESKIPVIHLTVGKMSFGDEKLSENIRTIIEAIKKDRIQKVVLKSTMSPGIKLQV